MAERLFEQSEVVLREKGVKKFQVGLNRINKIGLIDIGCAQ
jgi:hypothetical protein